MYIYKDEVNEVDFEISFKEIVFSLVEDILATTVPEMWAS